MGACEFTTSARGKTAKAAFESAVREARYEHGHGGYSGTLAEKQRFVLLHPVPNVPIPTQIDWALYGNAPDEHLVAARRFSGAVDDKWGPAGCFECPDSEKDGLRLFVFFGWASS